MLENRNKLWLGALIGLLIPFVGYAILLMILEYLGASDALAERRLNFNFGTRTTTLLALTLNLVPLRMFRSRQRYESLRGLVIATMIYSGIWLYFFGRELLTLS